MIKRCILLYFIGALSGIFGGMGMGGGTLLIPLSVSFSLLPLVSAKAVNLIGFAPMAACSLPLHAKNGYLEYGYTVYIALPALITSIAGSFSSVSSKGGTAQKLFGFFLIIIAIISLFTKNKNPDLSKLRSLCSVKVK